MLNIKLKDWSFTPGSALKSEGKHSAEELFEYIYPMILEEHNKYGFSEVFIDLDGTAGVAHTFLRRLIESLMNVDFWPEPNFSFKSNEMPELVDEIDIIINEFI